MKNLPPFLHAYSERCLLCLAVAATVGKTGYAKDACRADLSLKTELSVLSLGNDTGLLNCCVL